MRGMGIRFGKIISLIEREIEKRYGDFSIEEIWSWCYLEMSKNPYNFEEQTKVEEIPIIIEVEGLRISAKASVYRTTNGNIRVFVELNNVEIEPIIQTREL